MIPKNTSLEVAAFVGQTPNIIFYQSYRLYLSTIVRVNNGLWNLVHGKWTLINGECCDVIQIALNNHHSHVRSIDDIPPCCLQLDRRYRACRPNLAIFICKAHLLLAGKIWKVTLGSTGHLLPFFYGLAMENHHLFQRYIIINRQAEKVIVHIYVK